MPMPKILAATLSDMVIDLLDYDRREDGELQRGDIERMIAHGETSIDEIVAEFRWLLKEHT